MKLGNMEQFGNWPSTLYYVTTFIVKDACCTLPSSLMQAISLQEEKGEGNQFDRSWPTVFIPTILYVIV